MRLKILPQIIYLLLFVFNLFALPMFSQTNCENDQTPPTVFCVQGLNAGLTDNLTTTIFALDLDAGSKDDCSDNLQYRISRDLTATTPPTSDAISLLLRLEDAGVVQAVLWVGDEANNWSSCQVNMEVIIPNCEQDIQAPVAICSEKVIAQLVAGTFRLFALDIDEGSYDDCSTDLTYKITRDVESNDPPIEGENILFTQEDVGTVNVVMWVGDKAGIWSRCFTEIIIRDANCMTDAEPPTTVCNARLELPENENGTAIVNATDINENSFDNCTPTEELKLTITADVSAREPATTESIELPAGEHQVVLWVGDNAGIWNRCFATVFIGDKCAVDSETPNVSCVNGLQATLENEAVTVFALDFDAGSTDDCSANDALEFRIEKGTASATPPTSIFLDLNTNDVGTNEVTVWIGDEAGNWGFCTTYLIVNAENSSKFISGRVYQELDGNCIKTPNEPGLDGHRVQATNTRTGQIFSAITEAFGNYSIAIPKDAEKDTFEVIIISELNYSQNCPATHIITDLKQGVNLLNIPFALSVDCEDLLGINIGTPTLQICADNIYHLNYCNFSPNAVEAAVIEVRLDPHLTLREATIPFTTAANNTYVFLVQNLESGKCGNFSINTFLNCDAILGQTHIVDATIYAETPCEASHPQWSGASVQVTGTCEDDQVRMSIRNIGTGDMQTVQDYVIVEDVLLLRSEKFKLQQGQGINLNFPANGSTWRLEADQEIYHPGNSMPSITIEGCGGLNTTGLVALFPQDDADLDKSVDYQGNTDEILLPNQLRAFPKGYDAAHFIQQNVPIQYVVNFSNPDASVAKKAIVELSLSDYLEVAEIQTGVANLPYEFARIANTIRFTFNDLSTLAAGEQGFIKFKIPQKPDNPKNSLIENRATIYFDDQAPIKTEVVFHTVDADYLQLTSSTSELEQAGATISVYPNPTKQGIFVELNDFTLQNGRFHLLNINGQIMQSHDIQNNQLTIEQLAVPTGLYFYQIESNGRPIHYGKLVKE